MSFVDRSLSCADCGATFIFSVDDQEFHAQKGFTNDPRRCPDCRAQRRSQRDGNSGGGSYGGGSREMFSAICATCGKEARVPFEPRGDKPVYCSDCFRSQQGSSSYSGGSSRGGGGRW
ncbi:MAG: CxxC-x17-CxxC domain-containing protein [Dehalococcoidia bacterium]